MAKFNSPTKSTKTTNAAGGVAYKLDAKLELYSAVVTTSLSDKYYETGGERLKRISDLVRSVDPEFTAKLAVYAREQMYLRSVPLVLATVLAKVHNGDNLVSKVVARIVNRVDEITELLSFYAIANGRDGVKKLGKLSKQIQKGLSDAFNKFTEYQFAKYDRDGAVKLRDALFIVHPKPATKTFQKVLDKIAKGTLKTPNTWEVKSTEVGQKEYKSEEEKNKAHRKMWETMIDSGDMGYMATLRNLRNMLEYGVSDKHLTKVCKLLSDPEEVRKSKQFPFRFLSAFRELQDVASFKSSKLIDALESAMVASAENLEWFDKKSDVFVGCDLSGSMHTPVSEKSKMQMFEVGAVLAMLLRHKVSNVICGGFGDTYKTVQLPSKNILQNASDISKVDVGCSTNGHLAIEYLAKNGLKPDKVMFFTDCQLWDSNGWGASLNSYWNEFKKTSPDSKLYIFDLAGHGDTPVSVLREDVIYVAGWSDRIFSILGALENGSTALKEIEKIKL